MTKLFFAALVLIGGSAFADPASIIISCKSKAPTNQTFQIYGNITDRGLESTSYIEIDMWDVKPAVVKKNASWQPDSNYHPKKDKYKGWSLYQIQENTPDHYGRAVIMPSRAMIYEMAKKKAAESKQHMVHGEFEAVMRSVDDFHDDTGYQEWLACSTGWLDF